MSKQVEETDTIRLLRLKNYASRLLFVFCYQLTVKDPSYCALIRVHKQNNNFIYNVLYKTGTPLMYYQSNGEYFDIYCKNTAPSYNRIFAMELIMGSNGLVMDNAGTDVSSMTQISFP